MGRELTDPASIPLFAGLRRDEIALIMRAASRRTFKGSEIVISPEEPASRLFLVTGGHVDYFVMTSHGDEILLRRMVAGDIFGIASFLSSPMAYLGTAKAAPHSEVLDWQRPAVLKFAKAYPRFAENAFRVSLQYITVCASRHAGLVSNTVAERLGGAIAGLASRAGRVRPSGVEIEVKNEELASLADTSVFTASRVLKQWEREGTLKKSRGKVLLRRPEKLLS
jgi:CRP/FNR family transcriptional regulator, nitrogen oxide reductase regulator